MVPLYLDTTVFMQEYLLLLLVVCDMCDVLVCE